MIPIKYLFPTAILALSLCAAVVYLTQGDFRRGIYWLFAAGIVATVTF